jgi:hypothetical protein
VSTGCLIIDVAEAVKDALAAGAFSQTFTPTRTSYVSWTLQDLRTLRVSVVPSPFQAQQLARGNNPRRVSIDIGIQQKPDKVDNANVDPLIILIEEVANFFVPEKSKARAIEIPAPNARRAQCVEASMVSGEESAIDREILHDVRVVTGVIRTVWQVL